MNERDTLRPKLVPPRGVLHWRPQLPAPGYGRFWPSPELAGFVEHFWTVSWDLAEPEIHEVLPHPSVQFAIEAGESRILGVWRGRFTTRLEGRGRVLGTKFLPGGFRPFLGGPIARITGRRLDPREVFGPGFADLEWRALAEPDAAVALTLVDRFLNERRPSSGQPDPNVALVGRIAERVAAEREITRVEQLAALSGLGVRGLQRLFAEYVGVSPKWVIQRYRLHEAADRIARGEVTEWAGLALDLGYADQAHFIRDFRRLVGQTPADYARQFR